MRNLSKPAIYGLAAIGALVLLAVVVGVVALILSSGGPLLNASVIPPTPPSALMTAIAVTSPVPPASVKVIPTTPPKTMEEASRENLQATLKYQGQALIILDSSVAQIRQGSSWTDIPNGPVDIGPFAYLEVRISGRDPSVTVPTLIQLKPGQYVYARDGKVVEVGYLVSSHWTADELGKRIQVSYPLETVNLDGRFIPFDDGEVVTVKDMTNWETSRGYRAALVKLARADGTQVLLAQKDTEWYVEIWNGLCGMRSTRYLSIEDKGQTFRVNIWKGDPNSLVLAQILPDPGDSAMLERLGSFTDYLRQNGLAVVDFSGMDFPDPKYVELADSQGITVTQVLGNEWARVIVVPEDHLVSLKADVLGQTPRILWTESLYPTDVFSWHGQLATGNEKLCRLVARDFFGK